jgi:pimeloyl-ACP methyl ester carboxylesterase
MLAAVLVTGGLRGQDPSPHRERFITMRDGTRIEVLDWGGTGDAVMLVHGFGLNAHIWDDVAPGLTTQHRVVALTIRGFAPSDAPPSGYTFATVTRDIVTVLDSLHIKRASLVGHAWGGRVITAMALRHHGRVRKLVYIDGAQLVAARDSVLKLRPFRPPPFVMPPGDSSVAAYKSAWREYATEYLFGTWTPALEGFLSAQLSVAQGSNARRDSLVARYGVEDPADRRQPDFTDLTESTLNVCALATTKSVFPWLAKDSARWSPARDYVDTYLRPFLHLECDTFQDQAPHARTVALDGGHYVFITREPDVAVALQDFLGD